MKRIIFAGCILTMTVACLAVAVRRTVAPRESTGASPRPAEKLVVHEWGTFTGFAGSDGVHLPFHTYFGSDLPPFVMNRLTFAAKVDPNMLGLLFTKGGGAAALQRMETPVVYFYADAPMDVTARVDFPHGLLTEFYPPVKTIGPRYGAVPGEFDALATANPTTQPAKENKSTPIDPLSTSFLDWGRFHLIPHATADDLKQVPTAGNRTHYRFARDTDSSLVQWTDADATRHVEKFLFYRGLGNFTLPVTLLAKGHDQFELRNAGPSSVAIAYLIQIDRNNPQAVRFAMFENIVGVQQMTLPAETSSPDALSDALKKSLTATGLYEKEASAMVQTWKSQWLGESGVRVLYIVPREVTDNLLPLHISPMPTEAVRVLVGRIDILTPEEESHLRSMMFSAPAEGMLSAADARMVRSLGRFYQPALERISKSIGGTEGAKANQRLQAADSRTPRNAG